MYPLFTDIIAYASLMEMLWIGASLVGLTLSQRNWRDALADYRALGTISNGRRHIAVNSLIIESLVIMKFIAYLIAGIVAVTTPSGPPDHVGIVVITVMVLASIGLTAISISNRKTTDYLTAHGLQNRDAKGKFVKSTNTEGDDLMEAK